LIIFVIATGCRIGGDLPSPSGRNAATAPPRRDRLQASNSMIFNPSPAPTAYRTEAGGSPFVSFLHTGETVPVRSDPVSGISETAFY